ncbi:tRNA uridine-5-carboxymethylaminomethyl(34) synthesis GTPase MnmE [Buchnera aphidicola]|uniref:tRNA uridine-5-carboxymethylaminomethyl(34) synthesis GTPase MnmE n=1 Tax=Buchnera aphidicola TaxID=9 RepID=UPI0016513F8A|nr:tRNA uridine-5-carboxymethylaminomethyl(34) synthesis GTPase MnmE [Buchnera aphidicola]
MTKQKTIVAQATASGKSGIGIIRISGCKTYLVAQTILKCIPSPRLATHLRFFDINGYMIDYGIAIWFPKPHSFTGEDVLELQGHGNNIILDLLIKNIISIKGIRLADPGEFTKRAVLNKKMDLTQAEGLIDFINAESAHAAQLALNMMKGIFSKNIKNIIMMLSEINVLIETELNFSEEEHLLLDMNLIELKLKNIINILMQLKKTGKEGILIKEGIKIVICGLPNSGKSTLLNKLLNQNIAIVTNIAGTTRDILQHNINIQGLSFNISDTAGLRQSNDYIEKIGIKKTKKEIKKADHILYVIDIKQHKINTELLNKIKKNIFNNQSYTIVVNKIDLIPMQPVLKKNKKTHNIYISAKKELGIDLLKNYLFKLYKNNNSLETIHTTRRRHLNIIDKVFVELSFGIKNWKENKNLELLSENLRNSQILLNKIIKTDSSKEILEKIFSEFCIGK